jgi:glutathione S-transferase
MKLYYTSGACSLASHIVLEESGAKYDTAQVNLREGEQRKPEYLKLNPKGKVPLLILDDGQPLTENPVIQSYVADAHPQAKLLAPAGQVARWRALEWTAWCASGVQPMFGPFFHASRSKDPAEQAALREKGRTGLQPILALFDRGLEGKKYVLGDHFSIADSYTLVFYNWSKSFGLEVGAAHHLAVKTLLARPAIERVLAAEGIKIEA